MFSFSFSFFIEIVKKGSLARKQELRTKLEEQDEGYEDDAFEGTPFRDKKPLLKVVCPMKYQNNDEHSFTTTNCTKYLNSGATKT